MSATLTCVACGCRYSAVTGEICPACGRRNQSLSKSTLELVDEVETRDRSKTKNPAAAAASENDRENQKDQVIGKCRLVRKIGEGGFGAVWLAWHTTLQINVALKILHRQMAHDNRYVERFLREASTAARIDHPNIVRVLDAGEEQGNLYFVMEYIDGTDLAALLKKRPRLKEAEALKIVRAVAEALAEAHKHGIVHRDIKPGNILLKADGRPKLSDLGLVRILNDATGSGFTQTGMSMGTPHYMSPEQIEDASTVDIRADIYSLGITLYQMLTGARPFEGETPFKVMNAHLQQPLTPPDEIVRYLSAETNALVLKATAKNKSERFQTPAEMLRSIDLALCVAEKCEDFESRIEGKNISQENSLILRAAHLQSRGIEREKIDSFFKLAIKLDRQKQSKIRLDELIRLGREIDLAEEVVENAYAEYVERRRWSRMKQRLPNGKAAAVALAVITMFCCAALLIGRGNGQGGQVESAPSKTQIYPTPLSTSPESEKVFPIDESNKIRMVLIEPGKFDMGSPRGESGRNNDELRHRVEISKPFYLGKFEVTQGEWRAVMGNPPPDYRGDNLPVVNITWQDAKDFIQKLNRLKGGTDFRLPTEAEWEYACRAGSPSAFCFGNDPSLLKDYGWTAENSFNRVHEVGRKDANAWGLHDLHGNVAEWCEDRAYFSTVINGFVSSTYLENAHDPVSREGNNRIFRGGSFKGSALDARSANREGSDPSYRFDNVGFRLAADAAVTDTKAKVEEIVLINENILRNPSFEDGGNEMPPWVFEKHKNISIVRDNNYAYDGSYFVNSACAAATDKTKLFSQTAVLPSDADTLDLQVLFRSSKINNAWAAMVFLDANGKELSREEFPFIDNADRSFDWTMHYHQFQVPEKTVSVKLEFLVSSKGTGELAIDNVSLIPRTKKTGD